MMKPSKFNIYLSIDNNDEFLIYNTFTDSRIIVTGRLKDIIEKDPVDENFFNEEDKGYIKDLLDLGILVHDDVDEDLELEYWFQRFKFDSSHLTLTILTTYGCNLQCTYCYEKGINMIPPMNESTCCNVILWCIRKLDSVRPQTLRIVFFGGEPLLNTKPIRMISEEMFYSCKKRNINLELLIITNGVLLSKDIVNHLRPLGLKGIKVTIDGDRWAHDLRRKYKDGRGTFDIIMKNLKQIKGIVPIIIGGNFDDVTKSSIPALLDRLVEDGFTEKDINSISFKPALSTTENVCDDNKICSFSSINLDDFIWMKREIEKRGFATRRDISIGPCEATREHNYVIDPGGNLYKCAGFVGRKEFIIGDIWKDNSLIHTNTRFMTADLWHKCRGCKYIPICGGGCRLNSQVLNGNFLLETCEAEYIQKVSMEMIMEEVRNT